MMIFASICFALVGAMIKFIENIPLMEMIFFRELPDLLSIFGASLIIISGYLNYKLKIE